MKLPGQAELEFHVEGMPNGRCRVRQIAKFRPRGLFGLAYWYSVLPLHSFVFPTMLKGIKRDAEALVSQRDDAVPPAEIASDSALPTSCEPIP